MCRPVWNWSWAAWSLSVVHIERMTAISSMQSPTCGHQSLTQAPDSPRLPESDLERIELGHQRPRCPGEVADVLAVVGRLEHALLVRRLFDRSCRRIC